MEDQEQVLRSFLELLSGETTFPLDSEKSSSLIGNTANVSPNTRKIESFLQEHSTSRGTKLSIPSLSSCKNLEESLGDSNASGAKVDLPNSVLRSILSRGNPFPPKTSYAKGKKKLQKRRSTKQSEILASISTAASAVAAEDDSENGDYCPEKPPIKTKAQEIQDKIGRMLIYASSGANSAEGAIKSKDSSDDEKESELGEGFDTNMNLTKALDTLHSNLKGTVHTLLQSQLIALVSLLVYKSIKKDGHVSEGASEILASFIDHESFSSEEDDHESVLQSLSDFQIKDKGSEQIVKADETRSATAETVEDSKKRGTEEDADVSMTETCPIDHVAKITSIHAQPLSYHSERNKAKGDVRHPKTSVDKCTTSFSLSPTGMEETEEGKTKKYSLIFGAEVHISVMETKAIIEFGTSGSILGDFDHSKLTNASVSLDIKGLFQSIIREINKSLNTVLHEKKPKSMAGPILKKGRFSRRDVHLRAAETLSEFESGGETTRTTSSSRRPASKRARDEIISNNSMRSPPKRRNHLGAMGSMETATDLVRMANKSHQMGGITYSNQQHPATVMNNGMKDAGLLGANQDKAANDQEALANAVRRAELDKVLSSVSAGNAGYQMNGGIMNMGRTGLDSYLTAAAEAVRFADGEKSYGGTGDPRISDMALNAAIRRSSYGNNAMSTAAEAACLSEMENALSASLRRTSRTGDSMAAAAEVLRSRNLANSSVANAEAMRIAEMESAIRGANSLGSHPAAVAAAEASRRTSFNNGRRTSFNTNNLMATAEMVRMAEMESLLRNNGARRTSFSTAPATDTADSMSSALETVRMHDIESSMRRNSRAESLAAASEAIRLADARQRRSSLTEAMRLVEMDALRRSSAGNSMAAAAEAVRLSDMESFGMQRGLNSMMSPSNYGHRDRLYSSGECESVNSLADLLRRRSSGATGSMLTAAEVVRMAEQERWSRHRRSSGPTGSMAANAAEVARLVDIDNETHTQANRHTGPRIGMTQSSGRRVSFGPDTLHDQLSRFRRGN